MIEDSLGLIVGVFLGILLLIIYPMYHIYQTQDSLIQLSIVDEVDLFVNDIKTTGVLKKYKYEQFVASLSKLGMPFEIAITHKKKVLYPEYEDPKDLSTFTGEVVTTYDEIPTQTVMNALYSSANQDGYHFSTGDIIIVNVKSDAKSRSDKLRDSIWRTSIDKPSHVAKFSGIIINETN